MPERDAEQILGEIREMGYPGAHNDVTALTGYLRKDQRDGMLLLGQRKERLMDQEKLAVERWRCLYPDIGRSASLPEEFAQMMGDRMRDAQLRLHNCMDESPVRACLNLAAFVAKAGNGMDDVVAGLTML